MTERPSSWLGRFARGREGRVGLAILGVLLLFAVAGPLLCRQDPNASDFLHGVEGDLPAPPSSAHWLGTDRLFRDEFARLAKGTQLSLAVAVLASLTSAAIGTLVGVLAGYFQGGPVARVPYASIALCILSVMLLGRVSMWTAVLPAALALPLLVATAVRTRRRQQHPSQATATLVKAQSGAAIDLDSVLMWIVDVGLSFPFLLLVMAISAGFEHTSVATLFVTLGLTGWLGTARLVRSRALQIKGADYVTAARAMGASTPRILWTHITANVLGPVVATGSLTAAQMIMAESVLSYLGAGVSPPTPTLGHMIYEGQEVYMSCPWLLIAPGAVVLAAVYAFNLLGEGLRNALASTR